MPFTNLTGACAPAYEETCMCAYIYIYIYMFIYNFDRMFVCTHAPIHPEVQGIFHLQLSPDMPRSLNKQIQNNHKLAHICRQHQQRLAAAPEKKLDNLHVPLHTGCEQTSLTILHTHAWQSGMQPAQGLDTKHAWLPC